MPARSRQFNQRNAILYTEFLVRGDSRRLPRSPNLLRRCIKALLYRWQKRHPEEARWLSEQLLWLAGVESYFSELPKKEWAPVRKDTYRDIINCLENGKPDKPRLKHHRLMVLQIQRHILNDFLRKGVPYPSSKSLLERRRWLEGNWNEIFSRLDALPCWCNYNFDHFSSAPATALDTLQCYSRKSELIVELLAFQHGTTGQQIEKLLRPNPASNTTEKI